MAKQQDESKKRGKKTAPDAALVAAEKKAKPRRVKESEPEEEPEEPAPALAQASTRKGRGRPPFDPAAALLEAWSTHERIHQFLLEQLDREAWGALAPIGKGRTIRGVVAHMHNVRLLWLAHHAPDMAAPARLERETATLEEARAALAASAVALSAALRRALDDNGKLPGFKPDAVNFLAYAMAHEAHHRGQICLLARAVGRPLEQAAGLGLWEWRKRHGEAHPEPAD